ncbi:MAG: hypothetical protein ACR2MO_05215 [Acidimicrobiales bacterium]
MERTEIARTLEEIETLQRGTRQTLQSFWFPLVVFGAITLLSSPFFLAGDGSAGGLFWAVAGPAGGIVTGTYYARREDDLGISRPPAPYIVVAVGIMVGAFGLPLLTSGDLQQVVSNFAVAAGYLGFAAIERDARIAAIAAVIAIVPLAMLAIAPDSAGPVTAVVTGSVLLASGLSFRRSQAAQARALA